MSKKLYRSKHERVLGGVCGGIAEYFDIDVILVRLIFLLIFFARGAGLLFYIIAWLIIPEKPYVSINKKDGNSFAEFSEVEKDELKEEKEISQGEEDINFKKRETENKSENKSEKNNVDKSKTLGLILVAIGAFFLFDTWFPFFSWDHFWPLALIAVGVGVIWQGTRT